jgi:hypothetical protein
MYVTYPLPPEPLTLTGRRVSNIGAVGGVLPR